MNLLLCNNMMVVHFLLFFVLTLLTFPRPTHNGQKRSQIKDREPESYIKLHLQKFR